MKTILYIFGGLVVLGIIVSLIFSSLPVFPLAGKGFLNSIKVGQYKQAYDLFTDDFKKNYSLDQFIQFSVMSGLNRYQEVDWIKNETSKDGKTGYIVGRVITTDKKSIPLQINFVLVEGKSFIQRGWRISSIQIQETTPRLPTSDDPAVEPKVDPAVDPTIDPALESPPAESPLPPN